MDKPYKIDCHIHSTFSPDGHASLEEIIESAYNCGLSEITVTEHCECNNNEALPPEEEPWPMLDFENYAKTLEALREKAPLKVNIGLELGQATQGLEVARQALSAYDWDFVIGSLHNVVNEYDFCYIKYGGVDLKKLFAEYFEQLYDTAKLDNFCVLGHLYYPVRYIYRQGLTLDISPYDEMIAEIFGLIIRNGKGIEINTSGLFSEFGGLIPELKYAKMYRDLGGEIVTVGSDAHYAERVGRGVDEAYAMLKEAGFKAVTVFRKKKPEFITI